MKTPEDNVEKMEQDQGVEIPTADGDVERIDDKRVETNTEIKDVERIEDKKLRKNRRGISSENRQGVHWDILLRNDSTIGYLIFRKSVI